MCNLAIITFVLWVISTSYFIAHIKAINKEFEAIDKEQHQQNMDIIHLLKMNVEIAKTLDHNAKVLNQTSAVTEYLLELNNLTIDKNIKSDIFSPPKGEA